MNSKRNIFKQDGDWWFLEKDGEYLEGSQQPEPIVLEFSGQHHFRVEEGGVTVLVEQGTSLYEFLMPLVRGNLKIVK